MTLTSLGDIAAFCGLASACSTSVFLPLFILMLLTVLILLLVAMLYDDVGFFVAYTVSVLGLSNEAAT